MQYIEFNLSNLQCIRRKTGLQYKYAVSENQKNSKYTLERNSWKSSAVHFVVGNCKCSVHCVVLQMRSTLWSDPVIEHSLLAVVSRCLSISISINLILNSKNITSLRVWVTHVLPIVCSKMSILTTAMSKSALFVSWKYRALEVGKCKCNNGYVAV